MRTDVTIEIADMVTCRNASTLGFGKWNASNGDFIKSKYYPQYVFRVIGVIKYIPGEGNLEDYKLVCIGIDPLEGFFVERWIPTDDVTRVFNGSVKEEEQHELLIRTMFFFGKTIMGYDQEQIRKFIETGSPTIMDAQKKGFMK